MKEIFSSTIIIILTLAFGYWVYTFLDNNFKNKPIKNTAVLRAKILASLTNPFPQADTFILDTRWEFCGNSKPSDIPITFDTYLDSSIYKRILQSKINIPVLTITEFNKVMDTLRKYKFKGEHPPSLWDSCRVGKVSAGIGAEKVSSKEVSLYESYIYNNVVKTIQKDFIFKNDSWTYKIVDTITQQLAKR